MECPSGATKSINRCLLLLLALTACTQPSTSEDEDVVDYCVELCERRAGVCDWPAEQIDACIAWWDEQEYAWFRCNDALDYSITCEDIPVF